MNKDQSTELRVLLLLGLAYGFAFFDRMALSYLSPFVVPDLQLSNTQVGALGSGLSATWALGAYLVGRWSDQIGARKPFLLAAMVLFSLCSVFSGLAHSFGALFAARLLMGAAEGPFLPICLAIMATASAPQRKGLNAGIVQNVFGSLLGNAVAPILLVAVATAWGWRSAFYLSGLPGLVLALLVWRFVAEPPRAAMPAQEKAVATTPWAMLANRNIALCALISCCMVGTLVVGSIFLPLYLTKVRGLTPGAMATVMALLGICPAIGGILVTALSDRIGRRPPMIFFCLLCTLNPLAALYVHAPQPIVTALMFISWIGIGAFPLFMGVIPSETLGPRTAATAMGLVVAVGELSGGVFGPLLAGRLADVGGLHLPILVQAGFAAVGGLLAFGLTETNPRILQRREQVA